DFVFKDQDQKIAAFGSSYNPGFQFRNDTARLKTTSTCTESATAERYRYTRLRPALRNALIQFSFSPRPTL
uniref:hypothetical protein n=1 Tax=Pseudomonas atacamensis TaxID=2565368 RepID=UPI003CF06DEA